MMRSLLLVSTAWEASARQPWWNMSVHKPGIVGFFYYVTTGVVSQNPDFKNLQDTLAEQLGFELHEKTEVGRAARLRKEIKRREKILVILDDIWDGTDLSRIGIPSYKELQKCNSKILLTTRIRNVCHVMDCQRMTTLNILSEEDSWALYVKKARRSFESPTFKAVAKKVVTECRGLPIALIVVARALGDKELVEWKRAAQQLQKSRSANPDDHGEASRCINLSYDYLKNEEYKSYFLLCCLFPEDYDIPVEDLFSYAIEKGLFQDAETLVEARDRADSVARHLKYSSLLLDTGNSDFVRMHDVVRDVAIQIAESEDGFLVKAGYGLEDCPHKLHEGHSAISLTRNYVSKLPKKLCWAFELGLSFGGFLSIFRDLSRRFSSTLGNLFSHTHHFVLSSSFRVLFRTSIESEINTILPLLLRCFISASSSSWWFFLSLSLAFCSPSALSNPNQARNMLGFFGQTGLLIELSRSCSYPDSDFGDKLISDSKHTQAGCILYNLKPSIRLRTMQSLIMQWSDWNANPEV